MQTLKQIGIHIWFFILGWAIMFLWSFAVDWIIFIPLSVLLMWFVGRSAGKLLRVWVKRYEEGVEA